MITVPEKFKVAVGAGHHSKDPGAIYKKVKEHDTALKVIKTLKCIFPANYDILEFSGRRGEKVKQVNDFGPDAGVEVHFNMGGGSGTECLHSGSMHGKMLALYVQNRLIEKLKRPNRFTKIGFYQQDPSKGVITILAETICPMIVTEALFLDNAFEFELLKKQSVIDDIAFAIRDGVIEFVNRRYYL
jgi:N-acetylmuramoyl-L-alanine amidase